LAPEPHDLNRTIAILWLIEKGQGIPQAKALLKINHSNAHRRFSVLKDANLIKKTGRSSVDLWELTPGGETMLQQVRKGLGYRTIESLLAAPETWEKTFRWHHLLFSFPRLDEKQAEDGPKLLAGGWTAGWLFGNTGFQRQIEGWRVLLTGRSLLAYCPRDGIFAPSVYRAVLAGTESACSIAENVQKAIPWLKLSARFEICRQHLALMGLCEGWVPPGFKYSGEAIIVDFSKGPPEVETFRRSYAVDDMLRLARAWDEIAAGSGEGRKVFI